ncbi:MAG: hypothetical protein AB1717_05725 [Pseudomonadota bacterium]
MNMNMSLRALPLLLLVIALALASQLDDLAFTSVRTWAAAALSVLGLGMALLHLRARRGQRAAFGTIWRVAVWLVVNRPGSLGVTGDASLSSSSPHPLKERCLRKIRGGSVCPTLQTGARIHKTRPKSIQTRAIQTNQA